MESRTYLKNIKISPKKLRFYLPALKGKAPEQLLDYLLYAGGKPARILYKAIKSAISNAKSSLKVEPTMLRFKLLTVEEGQKLKRFKPGGRGTAKPIVRRFSHIKIILEAEKNEEIKSKTQSSNIKSNSKSKLQIKTKK